MDLQQAREEIALTAWTDGQVTIKADVLKALLGALDSSESEAKTAYGYLHAWQEWSRTVHHALGLLPVTTWPDDTKGRRLFGMLLGVGNPDCPDCETEMTRGEDSVGTWEAQGERAEWKNPRWVCQKCKLDLVGEPDDDSAALAVEGALQRALSKMASELRAFKFEACLLAKGWTERIQLEQDDITRFQIDTLAAQHYRKGAVEPIADRPLHPWRMTTELARELTLLLATLESGPENGDLVDAVRAVVDAAKRGLEPSLIDPPADTILVTLIQIREQMVKLKTAVDAEDWATVKELVK